MRSGGYDMHKLTFRIAFVILIFTITTAAFAASDNVPGAADNKPDSKVTQSQSLESERLALEGAIAFATRVETRWRIQDVVTATITNPLSSKIKGYVTITLPGGKPEKKKFSVSPGKSESLKFQLNPFWDGHSKVTAEAVVSIEGLKDPISRTIDLGTSHRLNATPACPLDRIMEFRLSSPLRERVKGKLRLFDVKGLKIQTISKSFDVDGQAVLALTLDEPAPKEFSFGYELIDGVGRLILRSPVMKYTIIEDFSNVPTGGAIDSYKIINENGSDLAVVEGAKRETQYVALASIPVCRLRYNFGAAGERFSLAPVKEIILADEPLELGYWIYGDATDAVFSARFADSTGQSFQTSGIPVGWQGWRYRTVQLEASSNTPLKLESLLTLDSGNKALRGTFYIGPIMLVSRMAAAK
jgi:hypothetical protein